MANTISRTILLTLFFFLLLGHAWAQQSQPRSEASFAPSGEAQPLMEAESLPGGISVVPYPPSKKRSASRGQISLNFDDAEINTVMQTVLGNLLKVNYIIDQRVRGNITFRSVAPVPFEEILPVMEVILRLNGIAIVENNGIYRVIPITDISKESGSVHFGRDPESVELTGKGRIQVIQIQHNPSTDIARIITPFISSNAVAIDVPKNNQIVLVDTPANIRRVLGLIKIFDSEDIKKKRPQVFVYNVQNSKATDIVKMLQQIFAKPLSADEVFLNRMMQESNPQQGNMSSPGTQEAPVGGTMMLSDLTRIFADELTNTIIVMGTPQDYQTIADTIKSIDIVPRQVIIEGVVAQILLKDNMSTGLSWAINTNISDLGIKLGVNTANLALNQIPGKGFTVVGTDGSGVIRAVISALENDSRAKLLASPHILVSDNKEARIQVGQSVPIVTSETIASVGVPPQRTIQYKDIGIILKVKPRINDSGLVSMDILQEISSYDRIKLYSNEDQIILQKTEASTSLVVQDGQTIVIGGLIREDKKDGTTGIPFLSKIPILGFFFGETSKEFERSEIIILLTPHVIKNQQHAAQATSRYLDKYSRAKSEIIKEDVIINLD